MSNNEEYLLQIIRSHGNCTKLKCSECPLKTCMPTDTKQTTLTKAHKELQKYRKPS